MPRFQDLDDDVLYHIVMDLVSPELLGSTQWLKNLSLTCRCVRESCMSVLFQRCYGRTFSRRKIPPETIRPYVRPPCSWLFSTSAKEGTRASEPRWKTVRCPIVWCRVNVLSCCKISRVLLARWCAVVCSSAVLRKSTHRIHHYRQCPLDLRPPATYIGAPPRRLSCRQLPLQSLAVARC
ncbi:hypothetical protein PYCCODRAFT_21279 [Trametes coccinea BRFM310]|uniref:F-box domain-containing protein n=1 Tax=Trametes coccinea (strain BRFM310) TaxID=1353009 RepID=A0A1Y2J526_TRAC3|nr:hypothetical protein PYCCODRAFT_21279 [Trametes coccinea BRFM310]